MDLLKRKTPLNMPVKVIQFGEGNFLRAFFDWMVDEMNRKAGFNGSVLMVKPREGGNCDAVNAQDGLYTLISRGIENGKLIEKASVIEAVKGCLMAHGQWDELLKAFCGAELQFCVSNTTEAGIEYKPEPYVPGQPQTTFPAKVTALLFGRFKAGLPGLTFLPCELIDKNGIKLRECMLKYVSDWNLGAEFGKYIENDCLFCCTLVDRIVAGYPKAEAAEICAKLGYEDKLIVCAEPFHFLVIEGPASLEKALPLKAAGINVVYTDDQSPYRTRKVRFLNGAHTSTIPAAYLVGFDFVDEAVNDPLFGKYMRSVLFDEVFPTVPLPEAEKTEFASAVLERFANPFAMHRLLSIALNSVSKWKVRVLPTLLDYQKAFGKLPQILTFSLAALIAFYRNENGVGLGRVNPYPVSDSNGIPAWFEAEWKANGADPDTLVNHVLARTDFWDMDLNTVAGLPQTVANDLKMICTDGVRLAVRSLIHG